MVVAVSLMLWPFQVIHSFRQINKQAYFMEMCFCFPPILFASVWVTLMWQVENRHFGYCLFIFSYTMYTCTTCMQTILFSNCKAKSMYLYGERVYVSKWWHWWKSTVDLQVWSRKGDEEPWHESLNSRICFILHWRRSLHWFWYLHKGVTLKKEWWSLSDQQVCQSKKQRGRFLFMA